MRTLMRNLAIAVCVVATPLIAAAPPNFVWIWADNLAYGDLGVYGGEKARTPSIDALARDGARFTQYYVAHTVCSPSRAALLTGRQPFRVGIVDVLRPDGPAAVHRPRGRQAVSPVRSSAAKRAAAS